LTLWDYALGAWQAPGVSEACLRLQDLHGQCAPLLLWRAWAARAGREIDGACIDAAVSLARRWEGEIIAPLRKARRALDGPFAGPEEDAIRRLRPNVRAAELDAERALLIGLEALTPSSADADCRLAQQMAELMMAWNGCRATADARDLVSCLEPSDPASNHPVPS
jgi:uncharacterized protein (TIGR02444 family)